MSFNYTWKIGDKAVKVSENLDCDIEVLCEPEPKINQIVTVSDIDHDPNEGTYLCFKEMPSYMHYGHSDYRKLSEVSAESAEEILNEVLTTIKEPELV
jgi:hypothetical protein